ncbi:Ubiquitin-like domain-containing CTD phosphatase 1 [Hypsibius exemplaris]|uniref:Ubiquitin-like domain-containing CTD phosphatase 1 n=1 Tax=Hypsibius exemplaris TaxID=2072580 RepID=A0A1W0WIU8_HYPEX|nr:Ubiquitin-like domain-containing CTD phosphatase 1 [Hypsibius exemplaris]
MEKDSSSAVVCSDPMLVDAVDVVTVEIFPITVKWTGKEICVTTLPKTATVLQLKEFLYENTRVLPHRQKLMGAGKSFTDVVALGDVFKANQKIMMMGSPEEALAPILSTPPEDLSVFNDMIEQEKIEVPICAREEFLNKINRRVRDYQVETLDGFRHGKKLLVLDIDYTIFDNGSVGASGQDLMRPYLHEMLHIAYRNFDIVIWSATGKRYIHAKLHELGMKANCSAGHYKISAILDDSAMITVNCGSGSAKVKPLGLLWGKYPQFSEKNTLIVDDLRRNFLMNPKSGLRITQYRKAFENRDTDKELVKLAEYLEAIAMIDDFSSLNHRKWERVAQEHRRKLREQAHSSHPSSRRSTGSGSARDPPNNDNQ